MRIFERGRLTPGVRECVAEKNWPPDPYFSAGIGVLVGWYPEPLFSSNFWGSMTVPSSSVRRSVRSVTIEVSLPDPGS